uniref:Outer clamp protein n=1 Tax=Chinook aquareovirus TaxID=2587490 RepID=A0A5B9N6R2_9REOV|nr:MAG: outer clamp protein [Chinook aquareovirus]
MDLPRFPAFHQLSAFCYAVNCGTARGVDSDGDPCPLRSATYLRMDRHIVCATCLGVLHRGALPIPRECVHECFAIASQPHLAVLDDIVANVCAWRESLMRCLGIFVMLTPPKTDSPRIVMPIEALTDTTECRTREGEWWGKKYVATANGSSLNERMPPKTATNLFVPLPEVVRPCDIAAIAGHTTHYRDSLVSPFASSVLCDRPCASIFWSTLREGSVMFGPNDPHSWIIAHPQSDIHAIFNPDFPGLARPLLPTTSYYVLAQYLMGCMHAARGARVFKSSFHLSLPAAKSAFMAHVTRSHAVNPTYHSGSTFGHRVTTLTTPPTCDSWYIVKASD